MIFVDTWAWIGLAVKADQHHAAAVRQHVLLRRAKRRYVTTNYVLSELITYLYNVTPVATAEAFVNSLFASADRKDLLLIHLSPDQFRRAWELRQRYHDKPDISFVDFTSMVVMQDLDITDVFTGDGHFRQVGLGFRLWP